MISTELKKSFKTAESDSEMRNTNKKLQGEGFHTKFLHQVRKHWFNGLNINESDSYNYYAFREYK